MNQEQIKAQYEGLKPHYIHFQSEAVAIIKGILERHESVVDYQSGIQTRQDFGSESIKSLDSIIKNFENRQIYKGVSKVHQIRDIVGIRVTCNCVTDRDQLIPIIQGELKKQFNNVTYKKYDNPNNPYRAVHFYFSKPVILENGDKIEIIGEIQLRTVLENAWAVLSRKYVYKEDTVEGESYILAQSLSGILSSCENLWELVRSKNQSKQPSDFIEVVRHLESEVGSVIDSSKESETTEINNDWFKQHEKAALQGLSEVGLGAYMEAKVVVRDWEIGKVKKKVLLDAARDSQIHTFGWPIAVFLDREEYRPRPTSDGIKSEIKVAEKQAGGSAYDYWAISESGMFYFLGSLFEDTRGEGEVFFNTRIIRITELFMYLSNLFQKLGVDPSVRIDIELKHGGLHGRLLTSSSPSRRSLRERVTHEDMVVTKHSTSIEAITSDIVSEVRAFTGDLFEMFEFFELDDNVLSEIVTDFTKGKIS